MALSINDLEPNNILSIKISCLIGEVLDTEREYVGDLRVLNQIFKKPLKEQIPEEVMEKIFVNTDKILEIHEQFLDIICKTTRLSEFIINMNDLLLHPSMESSYMSQCSNLVVSLDLLSKQRKSCSKIDFLIDQSESNEECRKLSVGHFLSRPFARITRYVVLLEALEKSLSSMNSSNERLLCLIKKWKCMLNRLNDRVGQVRQRFYLSKLHNGQLDVSHIYQGDQILDCMNYLNLVNQKRKIIRQGIMNVSIDKKRTQYQMILLFDHVILFTITKDLSDEISYVLIRPPLWIKDVFIDNNDNDNNNNNQESFNFSLIQMNKECTEYLFSFDTEPEKKIWMREIKNVIDDRKESILEKVGKLPILTQFLDMRFDVALSIYIIQCQVYRNNGDTYCYYASRDQVTNNSGNKQMSGGLFCADSTGNSECILSFEHKHVKQFEFLDSNSLVYLLSDKRIYYSQNRSNTWIWRRKLGSGVSFFKIGRIFESPVLVVIKTRKMLTSLVKLYQITDKSRNNSSILSFKILRRIYIGSPIDGLEIIRNKLVLACKFGFELIDPDSLAHQALLDPEYIIDTIDIYDPMKVFVVEAGFLYFLCFQKCGFWVDGKGKRILLNKNICEWSGIPITFAYQAPWLMVFTKRFVEIWNIGNNDKIFNTCIPFQNGLVNFLATVSPCEEIIIMLSSVKDSNLRRYHLETFNIWS